MSSKLRLHIDATLAEISGNTSSSQTVSKKWYLPKLSLKDGLTQFFNEYTEFKNDTLLVTTSYGQHVLDKYAGESPALLVTSGFESWPFIRQPTYGRHASAKPRRANSLLSPDFVFGLSERTLADGTLEKEIGMEEIDFLISKLKFVDVKHVAIGFLHSGVNPKNEETLARILRENGFEVSTSYSYSIPGDEKSHYNEVARWWRTFINAYLKAPMSEFLKPLMDFTTEHGIKIQFGSAGENSGQLTDSLYALEHLICNDAKDDILYLGLHSFNLLIKNSMSTIIESSWGPVLVNAPDIIELPLQPTQEITTNHYGVLDFSPNKLGLDPGPMIFSRTLRPTLLDLLAVTQMESPNFPTFEGLNKESFGKIKNAISLLARSSKMSQHEAEKHLLDIFVERTVFAIRAAYPKKELKVAGPLAKSFVSILSKAHVPLKLVIHD